MDGVDAVCDGGISFGMTCPSLTYRKSGSLNHSRHYN